MPSLPTVYVAALWRMMLVELEFSLDWFRFVSSRGEGAERRARGFGKLGGKR